MIRLSPTSISLSTNDLEFHSQYIDIDYGLLKQGFKRKDIQQYLQEHRKSTVAAVECSNLDHCWTVTSDVEFAERKIRSVQEDEIYNAATACAETSVRSVNVASSAKTVSTGASDRDITKRNKADGDSSPVPSTMKRSISRAPSRSGFLSNINPKSIKYRHTTDAASDLKSHAPRKSSLLRMSSLVSSDEHDLILPLASTSSSPQPQLDYRARSGVCSYEQSEIDENDTSESSTGIALEGLILDDSLVPIPASQSNSPQSGSLLQKLKSADMGSPELNPKAYENGNENRSNGAEEPTSVLSQVDTLRIIPRLIRRRTDSWASSSSSSLSPGLKVERAASPRPSSPTLTLGLFTPSRRTTGGIARTDPFGNRFRDLGGQSFTPYNDSMPANIQPQTPADLLRVPSVNEMATSYTVPPGRLRNDLSTSRLNRDIDAESRQDSPTNRAINMRRRRNREYARSTLVEGLRINRVRDQRRSAMDDQGRPRTDLQPELNEHFNMWRDELDADRVGEENFEDPVTTTDLVNSDIRVVSGNRRALG